MTIKTLLLDIGGIFFYPAWRIRGILETSKELQVEVDVFKMALDKNKKLFYTGAISETDYWSYIIDTLKLQTVKPSTLKTLYRKYVTPIPETIDLLPRLSSKFTLLSCNNSPKEWMDYRIKIASLDKYFSVFLTSGYLGYMKPDGKVYETVINSYKKEDLFYLDDNEQYIEKAQEYGIIGKVYQNYNDLLQLVT
ncbi:MAG: HAD hydrolase-like protein [Candidatus Marsarchaeota archaeon]|jgi:FMN phosphatase YigB (HAD superfamily)|nr:HAD hydrolase-like protein [Candidatus Marsarchaeota archaeon]